MEHLSLKESAYKIIKEKLLNLEFEPGDRIREDLLAREFDSCIKKKSPRALI